MVDGVFGGEAARRLRGEVVRLYEGGHMHKNCTHLVGGGGGGEGGL